MSVLNAIRKEWLDEHGYVYESKNNGQHLVINTVGGMIDYWPSSAKFLDRVSGKRGQFLAELEPVLKARRAGKDWPPLETTAGVAVEECVKYEHSDAVEYLELLGTAWDLLISGDTPWPEDFQDRVMAALKHKPEAHNGNPWD